MKLEELRRKLWEDVNNCSPTIKPNYKWYHWIVRPKQCAIDRRACKIIQLYINRTWEKRVQEVRRKFMNRLIYGNEEDMKVYWNPKRKKNNGHVKGTDRSIKEV